MRSSSGGVYQPTTTDINDHTSKTWSSGPRFLGPGGTTTGVRNCHRSIVLLLAALFGIMGLIMVIVGSRWHYEMAAVAAAPTNSTHPADGFPAAPPSPPAPSLTPYITVLLLGLLFMLVAFIGLLAYYRSMGLSFPCCPGKIAHIRQRFNSQSKTSSHGPMSAQYCPPTASPASPASLSSSASPTSSATDPPQSEPPFTDVSEQQRLMSDESDRCAEEDPRIVLSPLRTPDC